MAAISRLTSYIEKEMDLIELDSHQLSDHVTYWETVRKQETLKYAAREQGLHRLGMHVVPPCSVSATRAKQAIQMQILCSSLMQTRWANEPWTLADTSWERFTTPPKEFLKKQARVVEVIFDKDPSNRVWYTVWDACYYVTDYCWVKTRCSADSTGCYYFDMSGDRVYYHYFEKDAQQFSRTGVWEVLTENCLISSSTHPGDVEVDGIPPDLAVRGRRPGEPQDPSTGVHSADRAQPSSPVCSTTSSHSDGESRSGLRQRGYLSPGRARDSGLRPSRRGSSGSLSPGLADVPSGREEEVPVDSSDQARSAHSEEQLLTAQQQPCLIVTGSVNQVKCFRHRCKSYHRRKYCNATTTVQIVGQGKERKGKALMLLTYTSSEQRDIFMETVSIPRGMQLQKMTMHAE